MQEVTMKNARHNGRGDDRTVDFTSPDRGTQRSAFHRYMPAETAGAALVQMSSTLRADDTFEMTDFRARWWPAPDMTD
jgi:hypothetical protein